MPIISVMNGVFKQPINYYY